jgi:hypothetical protein
LLAGSNRRSRFPAGRIAKGTLLFRDLGLTNVRKKAGMGCATLGIVLAGLSKAEVAVHRQMNFAGIPVLLAIVFPPADGAQRQHTRRIQRLRSTAWTTKTSLHGTLHLG